MKTMASSSSTPGNFDTSLRTAPARAFDAPVKAVRTQPAPPVTLTDLIVRYRRWLIALSLLPWVAVFNGRWRIGLDSPIYRGLADSMLRGEGYHFGEFGSHQIYPGFPLLMAGIQRVFGNDIFRPIAQILVIAAIGLATVFLTYRLVGRHFPKWIAVCATCALAGNARFIQLVNELLTDVPFMFGMVSAMLGWSLFVDAKSTRHRALSGALAFGGLVFAASMRPAFWFFALAWLLVSLWGLIKGPRKTHAMTLAMLGIGIALFTALDPRTRGFHPLAGGYEQEFLDVVSSSTAPDAESRIGSLADRVKNSARKLLDEHLPAAVLGQDLPWLAGRIFSVLLIMSVAVFLFRRVPLWGLLILITLITTPLLSTPPRYYVVLTPFLTVAILLGTRWAGSLISGAAADYLVFASLCFVSGMNVAKWVPLVKEQHSVPVSDSSLAFYDHYRDGRFAPFIRLAAIIELRIPPGEKIVAPQASVVKYLSHRDVALERELLPAKKDQKKYPEHLAAAGIDYVVTPYKLYTRKDPVLSKLIERGVIRTGERVAATDGMRVHRAVIAIGEGDWRKNAKIAATQPTTKKKVATTQKSKNKKKPTTKPMKKKKKKPTTAPAKKKKKKKKKPSTMPSVVPTTQSALPIPLPLREKVGVRGALGEWSGVMPLAEASRDVRQFIVIPVCTFYPLPLPSPARGEGEDCISFHRQ